MNVNLSPTFKTALPCALGIAAVGIAISVNVISTASAVLAIALIVLGSYVIHRRFIFDSKREIQNYTNTSIYPSLVVAAANRVLGDIPELNRTRGLINFSYTYEGNREVCHRREMDTRRSIDKDAAIAILHQKITQHVKEMNVVVPYPINQDWGFKDIRDPTKTFYDFSQDILDSTTRKVIAKTSFRINHTDKTTFPFFSFISNEVNGVLQSEIVMKPFQVAT